MLKKLARTIKEYNDSGFSSTINNQGKRLMNADGRFNVIKRGASFADRFSYLNALLTMSWGRFFAVIFSIYTMINLVFASLYFVIGQEHFSGLSASDAVSEFIEDFFFSAQTLTTVGYGRVNPTGVAANIVASIEALIGLLCFALATGLLYARFSRPDANIVWSDKVLIAPYRDGQAVMMRLANSKDTQLMDVEVNMMFSMVLDESGAPARKFFNLNLERSTVNFLPLNWTVVHPLNAESPLYGLTPADLMQGEAELIISLKGTEETSMQIASARRSYLQTDFEWNARFLPMFAPSPDGTATVLHLDKVGIFERLHNVKETAA